ncbi:MAG: Asp-tRNA(Asn)/Glu-tRNA(Gln) amidotransferase subunit GatB [Sphingomonadales bacterium]|nr:Asp-tRNA(Asn)/Glu-tRNA(Gln) amidotransferase subunit GatB [Sphingomonadales bacterium]
MSSIILTDYELVVGLEVHIQLNTKSKAFCSDSTEFGALPNTLLSPISLGHPGTLPRFNQQVLEDGILLGLAMNCQIRAYNEFARKNYFYADLPKGYQITQHLTPLAYNGFIHLNLEDGTRRRVGITRIHMEEDAGKSIHDQDPYDTLIDLNRCGVPLLEVVTEPDLRSAREAYQYLSEIRRLVRYLEICDGNMEEGSLRCDANISVRPRGVQAFGQKVEVKNMNSMRHVQRAIEYEFQRQVEMLEKGETIVSETRSFDAQASNTFSLRSKEAANDYRYFPEPDLPPLFVDDDQIAKVKSSMPPLPEVLLERFTSVYGLSAYDASVLCDQKHLALWFEQLVNLTKHYKQAANWTMGPVKTWLNTHALEIHEFPLSVQALASLIDAVQDGLLTHHQAIQTLWPVWLDSPRKSLPNLLTELDLGKPSDGPPLELLVEEVLSSMPAKVKEYQSGKKGLLGLFMGELMKKTGGKVQPSAASEMLRSKLEG